MYCTLEDLQVDIPVSRLVAFLNDEEREPKSDENPEGYDLTDQEDVLVLRLNAYIQKATDEINGYLAGKFTVPLSVVPDRIKQIAVVIVKYKLHMRRDIPTEESPAYSEYKNIRRELEDIRDGDIILPELVTIGSSSIYRCNKTIADKVFTPELLNRY